MYCLQTALLVNLYWRAVCHEPRPEGGVFVSEDEFIAEAPELIGVTRIKCDANAATSHANTDFTSLLYVYKGRGQCSMNGVNYTVKDGEMVVLSPDISYRLASVQDKPLRAIRVSFSVKLNGRDKNRFLAPEQLPVLSLGKYQQLMGSYFEQICEESDNTSLGAKELLRSLMQAVTILLVRILDHERRAEPLSLALQVKAYIEQNFVRDLSLAELAQLVHVSPFHLGHLFKEECGQAPIQYLIQCRIEEAKRLLRGSGYSMSDIAEAVGYPNPNYFNQIFKKMVGISPGKYRDSGDR
jgi:AraC-like DNA-binding protein/mannose-6-phosphate isomerase-like protein (cupin superfamily)